MPHVPERLIHRHARPVWDSHSPGWGEPVEIVAVADGSQPLVRWRTKRHSESNAATRRDGKTWASSECLAGCQGRNSQLVGYSGLRPRGPSIHRFSQGFSLNSDRARREAVRNVYIDFGQPNVSDIRRQSTRQEVPPLEILGTGADLTDQPAFNDMKGQALEEPASGLDSDSLFVKTGSPRASRSRSSTSPPVTGRSASLPTPQTLLIARK